jgi:hypothetical protein
MGWKNVKEAYKITHIVQVCEGMICIGSPYIHDIIKIDMKGNIVKEYDRSWVQNADLMRYMKEMKEDLLKLKELIAKPDTFEKSITVYTYDGGKIIEKQCESLEWPSCTHDGLMIYENSYSTNRAEVIKWAKKSAKIGIKAWKEAIQRTLTELKDRQAYLQECENNLKELETI